LRDELWDALQILHVATVQELLDVVEKLHDELGEIKVFYHEDGRQTLVETVDEDDISTFRSYEFFYPGNDIWVDSYAGVAWVEEAPSRPPGSRFPGCSLSRLNQVEPPRPRKGAVESTKVRQFPRLVSL